MGDAVRTCPLCGDPLIYGAKACECGWKEAKAKQNAAEALEAANRRVDSTKAGSTQKANDDARRWLERRGLGIGVGEPVAGHLQRLSAFRVKLKREAKPHPMQWAKDILQDNEDGVDVRQLPLEMAREVAAMMERGE